MFTGPRRETLSGRSNSITHIYTTRGFDIKTTTAFDRQEAGFIYEEEEDDDWFCSTEVFSWLSSEVFVALKIRRFYPYPYWIQEFWVKELIRAGLIRVGLIRRIFGYETDSHPRGTDSRGIESNNFWSRLPTYYLQSYPLLVGFSF